MYDILQFKYLHARCFAGLHDFCQPSLPYDLNEGYPDSFIRKPEAESTPVEVIMRAALAVMPDGQLLQTAHICTFRYKPNVLFFKHQP